MPGCARLILLALEPGQVVTTSRLVDALWAEQMPAGAVNALQALVSRLRAGTGLELLRGAGRYQRAVVDYRNLGGEMVGLLPGTAS